MNRSITRRPAGGLGAALSIIVLVLSIAACSRGEDQADEEQATGPLGNIAEAELTIAPVRGNLYEVVGPGGNIGVSVGDDGVYIIDDQFAVLTDKLGAAIATVSDQPIRFVINTHWHPDHTGGNENIGAAGAVIVAQDNVRARLAVDKVFDNGEVIDALPKEALPIITFDDQASFHLNGEEARIIHMPAAHTDGDAIVHFPGLNVFHMGDVFITQGYPLIDTYSGGSIDGMLAAVRQVYDWSDDDTIIIPGHGELATRADLAEFLDIIGTIRDRVAALKADGMSEDEVVAEHPSEEWDATHTNPFVTGESLTRAIYQTLGSD